ncbi:MAG: DUF885 domain-containing protein [Pseudomonadota bacterium]
MVNPGRVLAFALSMSCLFLLSACNKPAAPGESPPVVADAGAIAAETAKANAFFDRVFDEAVDRSPTYQSYLGIKKDYGLWDEDTDERAAEDLAITERELAALRETIDYDFLDAQAKVSYELFVANAERDIAAYRWRYHNYPVNQMRGAHSNVPSFLINIHRIADESDARAYISRLNGVPKLFEQTLEQVQIRADKGIVPPRFTFEYVVNAAQNVIAGRPFDDSVKDSTLLADFRAKVSALELDDDAKQALIDEAATALTDSVKPAYEQFIATIAKQAESATTDDGAWKLPDGEAFYDFALQRTTTTTLTANEIHEIGLAEVARIQDEMRQIMTAVGFDGTLAEFFEKLRVDEAFFYPETDAARARYLSEATAYIDQMRERLDELFITKPEADMIVKRVEPFREQSAGKAFYQRPAPDGSRPGTYYVNLYRMADMPIYQMQALAYHEGIPGHHMQRAIAQELDGLPKFRRLGGGYTAYSEGWGLYSEVLPMDINAYTDPYQNFGRLSMEIWRAARLVVDTGIHSKRWNREQAINYLLENTPNPEGDAVKAIERYILWPSQATAYKIGMLKILELRSRAQQALGDAFDIREFHDVVLRNGPVPLDVLERFVDGYIADGLDRIEAGA